MKLYNLEVFCGIYIIRIVIISIKKYIKLLFQRCIIYLTKSNHFRCIIIILINIICALSL